MNNFVFKNPTKLIFGKGKIASLSREIPSTAKVLMLYGGGSIKRNGVYDQVKEALKDYTLFEFGGIEPNPEYDTLMKAVEIVRNEKIDYLLAVGGGSVIDGTKFISCAAKYENGDPWEFMLNDARDIKSLKPIPIVTVLTLPATGSEMNDGAVVSRRSLGEKRAFHHNGTFPAASVLDPQVCFSLPDKQVANGLIDTFCHTLEQYLTYPTESLVQDRFAEGVLSTVIEVAPVIMKERNNYDACANYMYAATMGLNGFIAMGVPQDWATHMIGHELTALYGLDHGVTLAIVGPSLLNVMREDKAEKIIQFGERVFGINSGEANERIDATIEAMRNFYESLGVATRLSAYNIGDENIETIASRMRERGWNLGEKGNITPEKVVEILKGAL